MVRGKYAAKVNGQRAEAAANTVVALQGQLDRERRDRGSEVAMLKSEIERLQGQLTSEAMKLSAAAIREVERSCAEKLKSAKAERSAAGDAALLLLEEHGFRPSAAVWAQLYALLDAQGAPGNREARRMTAKKMRPVATRHEQQIDRDQRKASMQRAFGSGSFTPKDLRMAADELERRGKSADDRELLELLGCGDDVGAA